MTNFIFSAAFALVVALASVMGASEYNDTESTDSRLCNIETGSKYHLSEEEQIDIYEQVMDECVLNSNVVNENDIVDDNYEDVAE